jgi:hypothetical protein
MDTINEVVERKQIKNKDLKPQIINEIFKNSRKSSTKLLSYTIVCTKKTAQRH